MVKLAMHGGEPVAAAVFFREPDTLYGRYWGSRRAGTSTACISKPAITRASSTASSTGIATFEPGTQGEHKVARGFEPTLTWSAHFIADRRFRAAVDDYLEREGAAIDAYAAEMQEHVPYRRGPA